MKTLNEIAQAITSPAILDDLVEWIRAHDETFPQEEAVYRKAVETLKKTIPAHSVDEYIHACQTEVVAGILLAFLIADNFIVCVRGLLVDDGVKHSENQKAYDRCPDEEARVIEAEHVKYFAYERKGKCKVQSGKRERKEKHRQKLRVYAAADLGLGHADLLHDLKPARILITLR